MTYKTEGLLPPHDAEAEKAVLGSLLIDSDAIHDVRPFLKPEDFFTPEHQQIYIACLNIINRGEPINQITVAHQLVAQKQFEESGGASYLSHLVSIVPTSLHTKSFGQIIKNSAVRRRLISAGNQVSALGYEEPDPKIAISRTEDIILKVSKELALPRLITPEDLAKLGADYYAELNQGKIPSIYTGFSELDWVTGGIFGGEYIIIAARPSMGKTSLMLTLAQYVAKNHGNVLLVSLEERWRSVLNKLISERTGFPLRLIRAGKYKDEDFGNIIYQLGNIAEQNIYFLDSGTSLYEEGTTTSTIYSIATHMKSAYGLSAVFVDYLDLVGDTYGRNLYERTTYLSKKLKFIAYDLDVPLFCLCQLSRQVEYRNVSATSTEEEVLEERLPKLSDLRNSGGIEENADLVLFLYRNDYYDDILAKFCKKDLPKSEWKRQFCRTCDNPCELVGKADLLIAKQRQGGEIGLKVPLIWNTTNFRYEQANQ